MYTWHNEKNRSHDHSLKITSAISVSTVHQRFRTHRHVCIARPAPRRRPGLGRGNVHEAVAAVAVMASGCSRAERLLRQHVAAHHTCVLVRRCIMHAGDWCGGNAHACYTCNGDSAHRTHAVCVRAVRTEVVSARAM